MTTQVAPTNGTVAKPNPLSTLRGMLEKSKEQIAMALPRHCTAERMIRVATTAVQKTPSLLECSPLSIVSCVVQAAELGLELSGVLGQAYLVPYFNKNTQQKEAQFQVGYRGLVDLAMRSGRVSSMPARVVYANDKFEYAYGTKPFIKHVPTMQEPGDIVAVYAVLHLKDGSYDFEVMSYAQIEKHRKQYSKAGGMSPWNTAWEEMAKKTLLRKIAKRAPVSIEMQKAAVLDEYAEAGVLHHVDQNNVAGDALSRSDEIKNRLTAAEPIASNVVAEREPGDDGDPSEPTIQEIDEAYADFAKRMAECRATDELVAVNEEAQGWNHWFGQSKKDGLLEIYQTCNRKLRTGR